MTCNGDKEKKGRLVKRTVPKNAVTGSGSGSGSGSTTTSTADPVATSTSTSTTTSTSDTDSIKSGNASGSCIPSLKGVSL